MHCGLMTSCGCALTCGLVLSTLVALLGYESLPVDIDERLFVSAFMTVVNVAHALGNGLSWLYPHDLQFSLQRLVFSDRAPHLSEPYTSYDVTVREELLGGVPCRIFQAPNVQTPGPAFIYLHGGGFFLAHSAQFDPLLVYFAYELQGTVISIDYRLAPEHPYPAALHDVINATRHVFTHAQQLLVDPLRVVLFCDSGGGSIAAATALTLRDLELPYSPAQLVLINPMLQGVAFNLPSFQRNFKVLMDKVDIAKCYIYYNGAFAGRDVSGVSDAAARMTRGAHLSGEGQAQVRDMMMRFLPSHIQQDADDVTFEAADESLALESEHFLLQPHVSPLFAADLTRLPPTYLFVAGYDVLRDEGLMFAERLRQAGNDVTLDYQATAFHAGWSLPLPSGNRYKNNTWTFIKDKLNIPAHPDAP